MRQDQNPQPFKIVCLQFKIKCQLLVPLVNSILELLSLNLNFFADTLRPTSRWAGMLASTPQSGPSCFAMSHPSWYIFKFIQQSSKLGRFEIYAEPSGWGLGSCEFQGLLWIVIHLRSEVKQVEHSGQKRVLKWEAFFGVWLKSLT